MSATKTLEGAVKERAVYYINRFMALGISHAKSKSCAVVLVEDLRCQYDKMFKSGDCIDNDDAKYGASMRLFDDLVNAINAF